MKFKGKVWKFGANIDTDAIIPARYLNTSEPKILAQHCMEDADPEFSQKMKPGDIIIADRNFGCGSSREHAPLAIKAAGISCVIAKSFARIFYRNAFNMGLPIFESVELVDNTYEGDELEVDATSGIIINLTRNQKFNASPIPEFMQELIACGGLMKYAQKKKLRKG
ncbi:MAG: 3-isopropylmalate dehydratase small subunit [Deltaproteobacteria bacterium]|nr:MAG: 3-isopropylmalate dehydratase small subunit [Deltaproteobacteria bacterium]